MKRNVEIEILRFFLMIGIMIVHFCSDYVQDSGILLKAAYLGVDFFFMVSGFFLAAHYYKKENDNTWRAPGRYTLQKIKTLYPHFIISLILMNATNFYLKGWSFPQLIRHLWDIKWQYLFLHYLGADVPYDIRSTWYMSILIINCYFVYFLLNHFKNKFIGMIPIVVILINVLIYRKAGFLGILGNFYRTNIEASVFRGFAEMALGVFAYVILKETKIKEFVVKRKVVAQLVKIVLLVIFAVVIAKTGWSEEDFIVLPIVFTLLILTEAVPFEFTKRGWVYSVGCWMGKISYAMYCYHLVCSKWIIMFVPRTDYRFALIIYIFVTILVSYGIDVIKRKIKVA